MPDVYRARIVCGIFEQWQLQTTGNMLLLLVMVTVIRLKQASSAGYCAPFLAVVISRCCQRFGFCFSSNQCTGEEAR